MLLFKHFSAHVKALFSDFAR